MSATTPQPGTILHCLHLKNGNLTVSQPERVASREFRLSDAEFVWGGSRINRRDVFPYTDAEKVSGLPTAAPVTLAPTCTAFLYCEPADLTNAARYLRRAYYDAAKVKAAEARALADALDQSAALAADPAAFGGSLDLTAKI